MYVNGKDINLQQFVEFRRQDHLNSGRASWMWEEEGLIWAIQDYFSSMGEFSSEDTEWLKQNNLLEIALWATEEE